MKKSQLGVTQFNFTVSISIIAILTAILLLSLNRVQNQAEVLACEADVANMRWGLRELWAHRNATGQPLANIEINDANPLNLLNEPFKNYSGESAQKPLDAKANWYFDTTIKRLIYVFSDGHQARYHLIRITKLDRASFGTMGGIDLVLE